jgi:pimeloyl-ACP methyl ester carboxylesterase/DNA-binding CsgD family transcriptional regulator
MEPSIRYAKTSDGVNIAYSSFGDGPPLIYLPAGGNAGQAWQIPEIRAWMERLAAGRRLIRVDHRGMGLSDRGWSFSPEMAALDIEAVAKKEGLRRSAVFAHLHTCASAIFYALRRPEAVSSLILWCPYTNTRDFVESSVAVQAAIAAGEKDWHTFLELIGLEAAGWADAGQARRFAAYLRDGASPNQYLDVKEFDLTPEISQVSQPVLVLHRRDIAFPTVDGVRDVVSRITKARFKLLEGSAMMPFYGDTESVYSAIDEFLAEEIEARRPDGLTNRELEILALLAVGSSNATIARVLTLSSRTVERHIGNIYLKIGSHNRAEATAYAFRNSMVPPAKTPG